MPDLQNTSGNDDGFLPSFDLTASFYQDKQAQAMETDPAESLQIDAHSPAFLKLGLQAVIEELTYLIKQNTDKDIQKNILDALKKTKEIQKSGDTSRMETALKQSPLYLRSLKEAIQHLNTLKEGVSDIQNNPALNKHPEIKRILESCNLLFNKENKTKDDIGHLNDLFFYLKKMEKYVLKIENQGQDIDQRQKEKINEVRRYLNTTEQKIRDNELPSYVGNFSDNLWALLKDASKNYEAILEHYLKIQELVKTLEARAEIGIGSKPMLLHPIKPSTPDTLPTPTPENPHQNFKQP